jgi:hypothetical protein
MEIPSMLGRRRFLGALAGATAAPLTSPVARIRAGTSKPKRRLAVVTTEWRYPSHAWHMAERFLAGYPLQGKWHEPGLELVSAYVDQRPANDLSRQRAAKFGFQIYPSIAQALRCGGDRLAVDAVLIIGEHGQYPRNDLGQTQYPRYEFFREVVEVFQKDGRVLPIFNDKHLSWKWDWAQEMVNTARTMKIPFLAGSSLPVTWRMPAVDLPYGASVDEVMCVAIGGIDSYDFHALETIQCMAERRSGGETGVAWVEAIRDDQVWKAMDLGKWERGGFSQQLFKSCLCRSQTLTQEDKTNHRYPTTAQIRDWVKKPIAYRFQYNDGLKATMLLLNGLVNDFTFAAQLTDQTEPLSTLFYLPPIPNVVYSAALMSKAEEMFLTGKAPYPIERTLLTSGLVEAGVRSLANNSQRLDTPYLNVSYQAPRRSQFWHN